MCIWDQILILLHKGKKVAFTSKGQESHTLRETVCFLLQVPAWIWRVYMILCRTRMPHFRGLLSCLLFYTLFSSSSATFPSEGLNWPWPSENLGPIFLLELQLTLNKNWWGHAGNPVSPVSIDTKCSSFSNLKQSPSSCCGNPPQGFQMCRHEELNSSSVWFSGEDWPWCHFDTDIIYSFRKNVSLFKYRKCQENVK